MWRKGGKWLLDPSKGGGGGWLGNIGCPTICAACEPQSIRYTFIIGIRFTGEPFCHWLFVCRLWFLTIKASSILILDSKPSFLYVALLMNENIVPFLFACQCRCYLVPVMPKGRGEPKEEPLGNKYLIQAPSKAELIRRLTQVADHLTTLSQVNDLIHPYRAPQGPSTILYSYCPCPSAWNRMIVHAGLVTPQLSSFHPR